MKIRWLALLAACAAVSAQAGTIVFHVGDPARPTVGVDLWTTYRVGDISSLSAGHAEYATFGLSDQYVEVVSGTYSHWHQGAQTLFFPPFPEQGDEASEASTAGHVFWWFEYIPDNPMDVPDPSNPYYADIQTRGKAQIDQYTSRPYGTSGAVMVTGGMSGLLTLVDGMTPGNTSPFGLNNQSFTTGIPNWNLQEDPTGFSFTWNAALGKWLGKPQFLNAASQLFESLIQVGDDASGSQDMYFERQLKVLRVRTPSGQTFTFNSAWT